MVYLLLGTNLGDRKANLETAGRLLEEAFGLCEGASRTLESEALGFEGPAFLNRVEAYRTRMRPASVLRACKTIERRMGRTDAPQYRPDGSRIYRSRIIDIDILEYWPAKAGKSLAINTLELTVPHPQVVSRAFVRPLLDQVKKQTKKQTKKLK